MVRDTAQEGVSVPLELGLAYTRYLQEFGVCTGLPYAHILQSRVGEDVEGGDVLGAGKLEAEVGEGFIQVGIG